ncbi:immunoglobulin-like domain-containing protein [Neobacillus sp. FSL H8-0543]|uniref:immunoglobulin-like domain-containing protein n=1 Tax=Neobacillus sp. FSL H8-0543 TaxID=2954672 RepID=UPI003158ADAF
MYSQKHSINRLLILTLFLIVVSLFTVVSTADAASKWNLENGKWTYSIDGVKQKNWVYDGSWYYLNSRGEMQTGWLKDGRSWYYLSSKGAMQTGWVKNGGSWYFLEKNGSMKTGWLNNGGKWYYLNSNGSMKTGWLASGSQWYYLASSGKMLENEWVLSNGKWYYMNGNGTMKTGWLVLGDNWYFLDTSGSMVSGWKQINQKDYYFYYSGIMAANTMVEGYKLGSDGARITDTTKPVFSGNLNVVIQMGETFNPFEDIYAHDDMDGDLTFQIQMTGLVDVNKSGEYILTYSVSDKSNNTSTVNRTVTVIDSIAPVLSGIQDSKINFGELFNPLDGISAVDNNDGDITANIQVSGSVDINKAGEYFLTYSISDQSGNSSSAERTVTVIDHILPVISGAEDITVGLNRPFDILNGVIAMDNNDGDITSTIQTNGIVDINTEGEYKITYTVYDAAGNMTQIERIITVKKINVTSVSISAPNSMKTGKNVQLLALISPTNATNQQAVWLSSDPSVAVINESGVLTALSEGIVEITAIVDSISTSKTITVSDRPNLHLYKSTSVLINGLYKSLGITLNNYEQTETVSISKVEIFQNNSLFSSYSAETLQNSGISTTIAPNSNWGVSFNFALGIRENQSKIVVTVIAQNGKSYLYSIDI